MVKDTVVGVVGALVIVGSMAGAVQMLTPPAEEQDETGEGPPAAPEQTRWRAQQCRAVTLAWAVDPGDVEEHVRPWTPETSGGQATFQLVGWTCSSNEVNATREGSASGAFALVPVEEPEDTRNETADQWRAAAEVLGDVDGPIAGGFDHHGFAVADGSASVTSTDAVLGRQVSATIDGPDGTVQAELVVQDDPQEVEREVATLAPNEERFAVAPTSESSTQRTAAQAVVDSSGETWVSQLGLSESPDEAYLHTQLSWNTTIRHQSLPGTGNTTAAR